jgi:hypothetical protein
MANVPGTVPPPECEPEEGLAPGVVAAILVALVVLCSGATPNPTVSLIILSDPHTTHILVVVSCLVSFDPPVSMLSYRRRGICGVPDWIPFSGEKAARVQGAPKVSGVAAQGRPDSGQAAREHGSSAAKRGHGDGGDEQ